MKKLLLILLMVFVLPGVAGANDDRWVYVGKNRQEAHFHYFDKTSIQKTSDTTYKVWTKMEFTEKSGEVFSNEYGLTEPTSYVMALDEFDFKNKKAHTITYTLYNYKGKPIFFEDTPSEWRDIIPNTVTEGIYFDTYVYLKNNKKTL